MANNTENGSTDVTCLWFHLFSGKEQRNGAYEREKKWHNDACTTIRTRADQSEGADDAEALDAIQHQLYEAEDDDGDVETVPADAEVTPRSERDDL